ncbi:MAG: flagellar hook-associated protein FlgK, partial [Pseudobutyrivibrio sp.]|nr:flagellar hook-associated protein FlgK [Pseudobutyrivibrio sp.]
GTGVEATGVTQRRDLYYDEKYWNNQSALGFYDKKQYYMAQIEDYFNENNNNAGFTTIYTKMFNAMSTLQGSPGDDTVRKQFISNAKQLTEYFNQLATKLDDLQSSINDEIKTAVDDINAISEKVAILTKQINTIEQGGGRANELRDQRALLIDNLSKMVDVKVQETEVLNSNDPDMYTGATYYTVYINGQILVDTYEHNTLAVKSRELDQNHNQTDIDGLYEIVWSKDGDRFNATPSSSGGSLKAMFEVRDGNNNENMHATVTGATANSITITNLSIDDINELNMPTRGSLDTNNTEYTYDSFSFDTDDEGKVKSVTFYINQTLTVAEQNNLYGQALQVGDDVDYMGIPYYQNQMNLFLRNFCERFNHIEIGPEDDYTVDPPILSPDRGYDLNGDPMNAFFISRDKIDLEVEHQMREGTINATMYSGKDSSDDTKKYESYYLMTAKNVGIATEIDKNSSKFATTTRENYNSGVDAADLVVKLQALQSKTKLFRGGGGNAFLQCIYSDVTVDTQECKIFQTNFTNIEKTIGNQRTSISGVDEDEEALDLMKFQNAYNLASKCISTFAEIYDRLILNTGV